MTENAKRIWQILRAAGMTEAGAAAMLGNMQAESALRANNAQDGMTRLSDANYTAAADRGEINFAGDSVGYGLCQWTYPTRKAALLRFARAAGKTVGDLAMQVDFCIKELREDYPGLWTFLCRTEDLESAAGRICREFERPAVDNSTERAGFAHRWYEELKGTDCHAAASPPLAMTGPEGLQTLCVCHSETSPQTGCGNPSTGDTDCRVADAPRNDKLSTAPNSCHSETSPQTGCGNPSTGDTDCHVADAPRNDKLSTAPESCHCEASAHTGCGNPSSSDFWPPRTIALGMEGPDVLLWQALMGCRGYECPASGSFDKPTEAVTKEYQQAAGLTADGIPGPKTWGKGLSA